MKPLLLLVPLLATLTNQSAYSSEKEDISLPFNQYNALELLAKWKVSTIELPHYIDSELNDLYGADINRNQVRDDYEKVLLSTYQRPEYVVMGLLAAKKWDHLLDIYTNSQVVENINQAKVIFTDSVTIDRCYYNLQTVDNNLTSPVLAYFNTKERLIAKKKAEEELLSVIGAHHNTLAFRSQPCTIFSALLEKALSPEAVIRLEN